MSIDTAPHDLRLKAHGRARRLKARDGSDQHGNRLGLLRSAPCHAPLGAGALYLAVYLLSFLAYAAAAWPHTHPPYVDAFYYVDVARNLARGRGFVEDFVWNYLGGTPSLPHPSSAYWLPGMSVLLAPALALGGGYRGATLTTATTAALCPALAAKIGRDVFGTTRHALAMAALTTFNGVWFHDWATPDAFVLYAALATATLLMAAKGLQGVGPCRGAALYAGAGFMAGLAALTRQEGALLLPALLLSALVTPRARRLLWPGGILGSLALFGLAELPWTLHNVAAYGRLAPPGGTRTLWMRSYDSFYALHTGGLTARSYLDWGLSRIAGARLAAMLLELAMWTTLWLVVLVPPLLAGLWRLWRRVDYRPFLLYWAILALALPLLFTATLEHGTLGHASGALVPFASGLVVGGIDVLAGLLTRRGRGVRADRLATVLSILAVILAVGVSVGMARRTFPAGGDEYTHDARVAAWLHRHNPPGRPVMVLDAPLFAYLDDGAYVVAPSDGLAADLTIARRYNVRYWVLDPLHAPAQDPLYRGRLHVPALRRVAVVDGAQVYEGDGRWAMGDGKRHRQKLGAPAACRHTIAATTVPIGYEFAHQGLPAGTALPAGTPIAHRPSPIAHRPSPIAHRPSPIAHRLKVLFAAPPARAYTAARVG